MNIPSRRIGYLVIASLTFLLATSCAKPDKNPTPPTTSGLTATTPVPVPTGSQLTKLNSVMERTKQKRFEFIFSYEVRTAGVESAVKLTQTGNYNTLVREGGKQYRRQAFFATANRPSSPETVLVGSDADLYFSTDRISFTHLDLRRRLDFSCEGPTSWINNPTALMELVSLAVAARHETPTILAGELDLETPTSSYSAARLASYFKEVILDTSGDSTSINSVPFRLTIRADEHSTSTPAATTNGSVLASLEVTAYVTLPEKKNFTYKLDVVSYLPPSEIEEIKIPGQAREVHPACYS